MIGQARHVWQISAGPASRTYADAFLAHGVALIGPGDAGPWSSARDDEEFDGGFVRRFASEVTVRDIFLMRTSSRTIAAVGVVAGDYFYAEAFDDVNGWDLQHARRMRWYRLAAPYTFEDAVFGANPPRCSRVLTVEALDFAHRFINSDPTDWQAASLPELPVEDPPLDTVPAALSGIVAQVRDLVPIMQDRDIFGEQPSEMELIAQFVIPFVSALGWAPERVAVQWRHIDVALFGSLPRIPENCKLVIEAKRLGAGVEGALEQAKGYVEALHLPRDVVVTDGVRYRMYDAQQAFKPLAYANLARLKKPASDLFTRMERP